MSLTPPNPSASPISYDAPDGSYIQPDLGYGLRLWWAFFWRNTLISFAATVVLISIANSFASSFALRAAVAQYGWYVVTYSVAIFVWNSILRDKFRHYRIGLVSIENRIELLPVTLRRTIRVWWIYSWRTLIYTLILSFAATVTLGFISGAVQLMFPKVAAFFPLLTQQVIAAAVGLFVIYSNILDEQIGDFQVTLLRIEPAVPAAPNSVPAAEASGNDPAVS